VPLPRKFMNFSSQNGVIWCIMDVFFKDSRVPWIVVVSREKIKHVKILGGRQHRTTPAGQILGGRDPCNPCVVDAYDLYRANLITRCDDRYAVAKFSKFGV